MNMHQIYYSFTSLQFTLLSMNISVQYFLSFRIFLSNTIWVRITFSIKSKRYPLCVHITFTPACPCITLLCQFDYIEESKDDQDPQHGILSQFSTHSNCLSTTFVESSKLTDCSYSLSSLPYPLLMPPPPTASNILSYYQLIFIYF